MITAARECSSCRATLPADAAFCHKCGCATPTSLNRETGEFETLERNDVAESTRQAAIQNALGKTCEVRRLLGRGAFAEVYVAFDKRLKREIAVKTIRGDLIVNETLLERFQREAEAVAKLRHRHIVPIFSVGEHDGLAYFTMPLIEGESLAATLARDGRLPVQDAVRVLREASSALHAAHRAGIVHRDVKPDNIMLEGTERSVVVMDFGIAKSAGDSRGLTETGMLVGTPLYMSPEQVLGEPKLDAQSDQYALATVGYRMLTGRAPFEGDSVQTLIFKTVNEIPAPACDIAADVPKELSDTLARALSKRPEDRYESMAAFAASLAPFEGASVGAKTARVRRHVGFATRVQAMQAGLPDVRRWIVGAAMVFAVAGALFAVSTPRVPLIVAGSRDDALFAAKTFLNSRGTGIGRHQLIEFVREDSAFRFLQKQLGFSAMQQRAMTDLPVWEWRFGSGSDWGGSNRSVRAVLCAHCGPEWSVWVGPRNQIVGFEQAMSDPAPAVRISNDSARSLAEGELAALGWPLSRLDRLPGSTISGESRTDHEFRWKVRGSAVAWRGDDSGYGRLVVDVIGDRVLRFTHHLKIPEEYPYARAPDWLVSLSTLLALVVSVIIIVGRRESDVLQWSSAVRLTAFLAAGAVIMSLPAVITIDPTAVFPAAESIIVALRDVHADATNAALRSSMVVGFLVAFTITGGARVCAAAAGESLAYGQRPGIVAGLHDIARGRLIIPEIVPAAARGYLVGALLSLLGALGVFAALRLGVGNPSLPLFSFSSIPLIDSLVEPPMTALLFGLGLLFAATISYRITRIELGAFTLPAIVGGLVAAASGEGAAVAMINAAIIALVTYALWRYGVLTAMVAVLVSESMERAVGLIRVGDPWIFLGAAALLAVMAAPAILAVLAWRRFSKRL